LRELLLHSYHYVLERAPELAYDLRSIDRALEWGYGWEMGPVRQMDAIGLDRVRSGMRELGLAEPALLERAGGSFRESSADGERVLALDGGRVMAEAEPASRVSASALRHGGRALEESADAALLDMGDGVLLFETRTKM